MEEIEYFREVGRVNTNRTLEIAQKRLSKGDIANVIVASSYGDTAIAAINSFKNLDVRIIAIGIDKHWDGKKRFSTQIEKKILESGHVVYKGAMPFEFHRFSKEPGVRLIANTLRRFGDGLKVCVEVTLMAVSAELIEKGERVMAIAGTHRGADTAVVEKASSLYDFNKFEINEILCKPYGKFTEEEEQ